MNCQSTKVSRGRLKIREHEFVWGERTYVMGILNVTPDSFSGDGLLYLGDAVARATQLLEHGAEILDIGAESTRPGFQPVPEEEELERIIPVLKVLRKRSQAVFSVDTTKPAVLEKTLNEGADILNSVWGLNDERLMDIAVDRGTPVVIMHNKKEARYDKSVVDEVLHYLDQQAQAIVKRGLPPHAVILDPGIGFGKTADHNLELLASLDRLVSLGFPTLVGTSRKSTIGKLTGREPSDRTYGTAATIALAISQGVDIVRVHDVDEMKQVVQVTDAIIRGWRPTGWKGD